MPLPLGWRSLAPCPFQPFSKKVFDKAKKCVHNKSWRKKGTVVQLVRAPPCHGGSCGFEPRQSRSGKLGIKTLHNSVLNLKRSRKAILYLIVAGLLESSV